MNKNDHTTYENGGPAGVSAEFPKPRAAEDLVLTGVRRSAVIDPKTITLGGPSHTIIPGMINGEMYFDVLNAWAAEVHKLNAKWWFDIVTGEPLDRNPGELIALMHSELSETLEGVRKNKMDDHLPDLKAEDVEMADLFIRFLDYCGGRKINIGVAVKRKLEYNKTRADHKIENRLKADGKKF